MAIGLGRPGEEPPGPVSSFASKEGRGPETQAGEKDGGRRGGNAPRARDDPIHYAILDQVALQAERSARSHAFHDKGNGESPAPCSRRRLEPPLKRSGLEKSHVEKCPESTFDYGFDSGVWSDM